MRLRDANETAVLLRSIASSKQRERQAKGAERPVTRFRVSRKTLLTLAGRANLPDLFLADLQEHLLASGWALFFAGQSYAMVRSDLVMGWVRLGSARIENELEAADSGGFDFASKDRELAAAERILHRRSAHESKAEHPSESEGEGKADTGVEDE
jgi:hypothetical protein